MLLMEGVDISGEFGARIGGHDDIGGPLVISDGPARIFANSLVDAKQFRVGWTRTILTMTCVAIATSSYFLIYPFAVIGVDPHHDGLIFKASYDVALGATPFRDTFLQYGMLLHLIHAAFIKLFGAKLIVIRLITAFCYAATAPLLWLFWRQFVGSALALFAVALWIGLAPFYLVTLLPWSSSTILPLQILSILAMLSWYRRRSGLQLFIAGMLSAAIFWIRLPSGVLQGGCCLALLAYFAVFEGTLLKKPRVVLTELGLAILGFLIASFPLVLFLWVKGGLYDFFLQSFVMAFVFATSIPQVWNDSTNIAGSIVASLFPFWLNVVWAIVPAIVFAAALWVGISHLFRPATRLDPRYGLIMVGAAFCLASWPQYYPVTEERHVFWAATPMFGFALFFLREILAKSTAFLGRSRFLHWLSSQRIASVATAVLALAICSQPLAARFRGALERLSAARAEMTEPMVLKGLFLTPEEKQLYLAIHREIAAAQKQFPSSPIITTGRDALYLNFVDTGPNWHPLFVFFDIAVLVYPDFPTRLGEFIRNQKPIMLTPGYVFKGAGYRAAAEFSNGVTLSVPGEEARPLLLAPLPADTHSAFHVSTSNYFNFFDPYRTGGARLPAARFTENATLEFLMHPDWMQSVRTVVFTNLFGPESMNGFALHRGPRDNEFRFAIGSSGKQPLDILSFSVTPLECNHIAIRRRQDRWDLWLNGVPVSEARVGPVKVDSPNQFVLGNGYFLSQLFVGQVPELRILDRAISDPEMAAFARHAVDRCRRSH
jgi:hypothetical protein